MCVRACVCVCVCVSVYLSVCIYVGLWMSVYAGTDVCEGDAVLVILLACQFTSNMKR